MLAKLAIRIATFSITTLALSATLFAQTTPRESLLVLSKQDHTEAAKAIGSYDPGSSKVDWILGTGQNRTHMIYVSPDAKRIITTNVSSGTVSIIESSGTRLSNAAANAAPSGPPREDWNETVVKVGNGSEGFDVSPDRKANWVAYAQDGSIS